MTDQMKRKESHSFQSEVKQLLKLMIHSLYSNKEIFLRELISNASDAADKLRFRALSVPEIYEGDGQLRLRIAVNQEQRKLILIDNGIGMSREEIIENLGTIAKSGTRSFIESLGTSQVKDSQLIGQFGVGFYSAFIVADKVTVRTRAAGVPAEQGVFWESTGEGNYIIADLSKPQRGTEIILHLRENSEEFMDPWRLRNLISKYSDHISLPVEMEFHNKENNTTRWETINKAQALWTRNRSDISDEEYQALYKHLTNEVSEPMIWSHNRVEGKHEYTSVLYIPSKAPLNLWNRDNKHGLKLYVQRVFIMDDAEQFLPQYLRFVRGVIDSNNLPLNISREIIQDTKITQNLRQALTKRVLQMLQKLAKDDSEKYQKFWQNFGLILKEGPAEDSSNLEKIANLLRFASTKSKSNAQTVSLKDYVSRMVKGQNKIYYLTADSHLAANSSPHLEFMREKGIEVLLMSDRIDEWMMNYLTNFDGKNFHLVSKIDESINKIGDLKNEVIHQPEKSFLSFIEKVKKILGDRVKDVRLTYRLINTPAIVTTEAHDMSTQMVKLLTEAGQKVPELKYFLELNPNHPLVKLAIAETKNHAKFVDLIELLLDQALLAEKGTLDDPNQFIRRLNQLLITAE